MIAVPTRKNGVSGAVSSLVTSAGPGGSLRMQGLHGEVRTRLRGGVEQSDEPGPNRPRPIVT